VSCDAQYLGRYVVYIDLLHKRRLVIGTDMACRTYFSGKTGLSGRIVPTHCTGCCHAIVLTWNPVMISGRVLRLRNVLAMLLLLGATLPSVLLAGHGYPSCQTCNTSHFNGNTGHGACLNPPFFRPSPGWNLYWHDPCNCWDDPCRGWNCQLANQPLIYGETSAVFLFRDEDGAFTAATRGADTLLSSNDFKSEHDMGGKFLLGVALDDWCRLEGSYFGQYDWDDTQSVRSIAADLVSPFPAPVTDSDFASISMTSRLQNFELNLRRRMVLPPFRWRRVESNVLLGIRWMDIDETFSYTNTDSVVDVTGEVSASSSVSNQMIGPQLGIQSQFFVHDHAWIDLEIKGAILGNNANLATVYTEGTTAAVALADGADAFTFLGDISLMYNYHLTNSLTFRAGYQAIWVAGMALATENLDTNINNVSLGGPVVLDHAGDAVYHGATIGFVYAR